jgi:hypothetical protein
MPAVIIGRDSTARYSAMRRPHGRVARFNLVIIAAANDLGTTVLQARLELELWCSSKNFPSF